MKKYILVTIFLVFTSFLRAEYLGLEEVLKSISQENLTVLIDREAVQQNLQKQYIQRANLWPKVSAELSQARKKDGLRGFESTYNSMYAKVSAKMPIFDRGLYQAFLEAKMGYAVSKESHQAILELILYDTAKAYLLHARNIRRADLILSNIKRSENFLALAKEKFEVGTASALDLARAKNRLFKDQQELISQELAVYQSASVLKEILNLPDDFSVEINSNILEEIHLEAKLLSLQSIFKLRPDYIAAQKKLKQAKVALQKAYAGHLPTVAAFGENGITGRHIGANNNKEWAVGVKLTVPLFEGFGTSAEVLKAKSEIKAQQYGLSQVKKKIATQYNLASNTLILRKKQLDQTKDQIQLAYEELELAQDRFLNSVADNQDLLLAQANLALILDDSLDILYHSILGLLDIFYAQGAVQNIL